MVDSTRPMATAKASWPSAKAASATPVTLRTAGGGFIVSIANYAGPGRDFERDGFGDALASELSLRDLALGAFEIDFALAAVEDHVAELGLGAVVLDVEAAELHLLVLRLPSLPREPSGLSGDLHPVLR